MRTLGTGMFTMATALGSGPEEGHAHEGQHGGHRYRVVCCVPQISQPPFSSCTVPWWSQLYGMDTQLRHSFVTSPTIILTASPPKLGPAPAPVASQLFRCLLAGAHVRGNHMALSVSHAQEGPNYQSLYQNAVYAQHCLPNKNHPSDTIYYHHRLVD